MPGPRRNSPTAAADPKRLAAATSRLREALATKHGQPPDSGECSASRVAGQATLARLLARHPDARPAELDRSEQTVVGATGNADVAAAWENVRQLVAELDERLSGGVARDAGRLSQHDLYEQFLAAYDPQLRHQAGVYYTPPPVAEFQLRLVDRLLMQRCGIERGLAAPRATIVDPAAGSGVYLLAAIDQVLARTEGSTGRRNEELSGLANNLYGNELFAIPTALARLRMQQRLQSLAADGANHLGPIRWSSRIFQADTLADPQAGCLAELDLRRADATVRVCVGNPPYDRHAAVDRSAADGNEPGGWICRSDPRTGAPSLLDDLSAPVAAAGHGLRIKNLYNLYVYFWRWAVWWAFERSQPAGVGIVSLVTSSSFVRGEAFGGLRQMLRQQSDDVWVVDLGGEGRGPRREDNVFDVQTPVCITFAIRQREAADSAKPAAVRYTRVRGSRAEKLATLRQVQSLEELDWSACETGWLAPLRPTGRGGFARWPALTDVFPWQHSGVQVKRTWPIAPDRETLQLRWRALLSAADRSAAFCDAPGDREVSGRYREIDGRLLPPLADEPSDATPPPCVRYAYRSFDRQWLLADPRLISRPRPPLWRCHGERQLYFTTLLKHPLGHGPALTATTHLPDLDHFRGSYGAKHVIPLWRDAAATEPNVHPGLPALLADKLGIAVDCVQMAEYVYAVLAHGGYPTRFWSELEGDTVRVPITLAPELFAAAVQLGRELLHRQTFGAWPADCRPATTPDEVGEQPQVVHAETPVAVPFNYDPSVEQLVIGTRRLEVPREAWQFSVSGLSILKSWLDYRIGKGGSKSRRRSPLDAIRPLGWPPSYDAELRDLLDLISHSLRLARRQADLLDAICRSPLLAVDQLPAVADSLRKPP